MSVIHIYDSTCVFTTISSNLHLDEYQDLGFTVKLIYITCSLSCALKLIKITEVNQH